jgi:TonB family protein
LRSTSVAIVLELNFSANIAMSRRLIMDYARALLSGKEATMLCRNLLLANLIVLPAGLLLCQAATSQVPESVPQPSPTTVVVPIRASLVLELDRAIVVLEHWATRDQYLTAFEKTPSADSTNRQVTDANNYVECAIGARLRNHRIWDEGVPIEVEVQNAIDEFIEWREGQTTARLPMPCGMSVPRNVIVSAGVAASMLKIKIDPVYPAEALKNHISGVVVLHATIGAKGGVEALRVISGPTLLQQAALDAVRQWTYRPYLLNNTPVEVETTINVVFAPNR